MLEICVYIIMFTGSEEVQEPPACGLKYTVFTIVIMYQEKEWVSVSEREIQKQNPLWKKMWNNGI